MDLFDALPALRRHPLLRKSKIALIGVGAVVHHGSAHLFEIGKPRYWQQREDGTTSVGVGGFGGGIERGETVPACLHREIEEELGARARIEMSPRTHLIRDWQVVDEMALKPGRKRPTPLAVVLVPPFLGGPGTPDHVAIVDFRVRLRDTPTPRDVFGMLRVENQSLAAFFARDEWPPDELRALPGVEIALNGELPPDPVLRPVLTARAYRLLVRQDSSNGTLINTDSH